MPIIIVVILVALLSAVGVACDRAADASDNRCEKCKSWNVKEGDFGQRVDTLGNIHYNRVCNECGYKWTVYAEHGVEVSLGG